MAAALLAVITFAAFAATFIAILPSLHLLILIGVLVWFSVPGIVLARRLYGSQPGAWAAALLAGPPWGCVFSLIVMLALWALGVRRFGWLMVAPIPAILLALPARALAANLTPPAITRREVAAIAFALLTVPAVVGLPFAHVGMNLPQGRAYRAYFTADLVWAEAMVAEVSKGDMPPRNPFYANDDLHYYWMAHLLPAAEHRAFPTLTLDQILLVNAVASGLGFIGFLYFFVRHFVDGAWPAAAAIAGIVFCSSFEGAERLWTFWQRGIPFSDMLGPLRNLNIDAVTRWFHNGMPVDGLQRLLLYQPQHQLTYLFGLSGLLLLVQARDAGRRWLLFVVGVFLGVALLLSSFDAGMLVVMAAAYQAWRLIRAKQWSAFVPCAAAAVVPMLGSIAVIWALRYLDSGGRLVTFGPNPVATSRVWQNLFLSFGPAFIAAAVGIAAAVVTRALGRLTPLWIALAICAGFYFLVDLPDHQSVYVGWHAGHLAFIAMMPLVAYGIQEWWRRGGVPRWTATLALAIVAVIALPTVLIDIYNTQDVWNANQGPGFRWTVVLSPQEQAGLAWIKQSTSSEARVQVEPYVRGRDTPTYIPTFAERRMAYGLPTGMIPLAKYEKASNHVRDLYRATTAAQAHRLAAGLCIDFLVVGEPERAAYPHFQPLLDAAPTLFPPAFKNAGMAVYMVARSSEPSACRP